MLCTILATIYWLALIVIDTKIPFDTDEADHANSGLELYVAAYQKDVDSIWQAIVRQTFYPPVHSLFIALSYSLFGPSLFASRIPSVFFFLIYLIVVFVVTFLFLWNKKVPMTVSQIKISMIGSSSAVMLAIS